MDHMSRIVNRDHNWQSDHVYANLNDTFLYLQLTIQQVPEKWKQEIDYLLNNILGLLFSEWLGYFYLFCERKCG